MVNEWLRTIENVVSRMKFGELSHGFGGMTGRRSGAKTDGRHANTSSS